MLSLFIVPALAGTVYWLIHKAKGQLTERNKYKRKRLFGYLLTFMCMIEIFYLFSMLGNAVEADSSGSYVGSYVGRKLFWAFLGVSIGWSWIRTIWTSFDQIESEVDAPNGLSSAFGQWIKSAKGVLGFDAVDVEKKKPYEYGLPSDSDEGKHTSEKNAENDEGSENQTIINLEKYRKLFEKGLITEDEYRRLKSKELGI